MSTTRIIDQTADSILSAGDYVIVDSQSEGTRKFDLGTSLNGIKEEIGDLSDLDTTVKTDLVSAINEAAQSGGGGGFSTLSGLSDVALTSPSNGQVLKYNGTEWVNGNESGGGSSDKEWTYLPHRTNPAVDAHNGYSLANGTELGTASTLRHNLMLEANWNSGYFIATWTESTGNKDYADSSGQTSVYAVCYRDKWNERQTKTDAEVLVSSAVDVFPHGDTVYDENGDALCTIVAASDSTVKKRSSDYIFIGTVYGSDEQYHIVYRTGNTTSTPSISLDATINVLQINDAEWDMTTLRSDYTQKTSQLNTYIILRQSVYYMAVVQNGVGVAIMKSSDCINWELQAHIPDTEAHLEACLCVTPWISNNMPTVFVAVRHNYGDGYITLHSFNGLDFATEKEKIYIPASTGRPTAFSDSNVNYAFICFSTNGRRNASVIRIGSNNDGTTAYNLLTTPMNRMSNYPVLTTNGKFILFGGTNGLSSSKNGVSICPIWSEEMINYNTMSSHLLDVAEHGAFIANFTSTDEGKFLTIDSNGNIVATTMSAWQGGNY